MRHGNNASQVGRRQPQVLCHAGGRLLRPRLLESRRPGLLAILLRWHGLLPLLLTPDQVHWRRQLLSRVLRLLLRRPLLVLLLWLLLRWRRLLLPLHVWRRWLGPRLRMIMLLLLLLLLLAAAGQPGH